MKATQVLNNRGMDKKAVVHTYCDIKTNEMLPSVTAWMDVEGIILSERSQSEKDKYDMISLICKI